MHKLPNTDALDKSLLLILFNLMRKDGYDHLAKLLIIGDSGVGKTNILLRFC